MGGVTEQIVRRFVEVSRAHESKDALLARVGLSANPEEQIRGGGLVAAEVYYDLLELSFGDGDHALPFRYGTAVRPEDYGAFGLALKTARSVGEALERLVRYILIVTDTLEYELVDESGGRRIAIRGRPSEQRQGIRLANEGALAAIASLLRQVAAGPVEFTAVSFRHPEPSDAEPHRAYFGCEVRFGAPEDALHLSTAALGTQMRLSDEGLSSFLVSQLEELRLQRADRSVVFRVRSAVADALCDGPTRRALVAKQLGMSERTLQRHLAEQGQSFQTLVAEVRREVAQSLLTSSESSLSEVAFLTGFSDQSAFQRAFKGWTGQTPLGFRQAAP